MASNERQTYITGLTYKEMEKAEACLDECTMIWLEPALDGRSSPLNVRLGLLTSMQKVQRFSNVDTCLEYLQKNTEKRIFLVLSYQISEEQVNLFHDLSHIDFIYAFGWDTIFKPEHSKLVKVASIEELISQLSCHDRLREEENDTDFASLRDQLFNSSEESCDNARIFIFYQLLLEILVHHPKTADIKQQFISFGRQIYHDNPTQMDFFENLDENYPPSSTSIAIPLYTSGSYCLHRKLNRACRTGNMEHMFKLVYFMTDLYAELADLHQEYFDLFADQMRVYRGRPMTRSEFNKLKSGIGDLVVTKSFLSTTVDFDVARMYSGVGSTDSNIFPAILRLIIDKQRHESKPFSFIRQVSKVQDDREVLLSIGMVFKVIHSQHKDGLEEFTLLRSNAEEQVEQQLRNSFLGQSKPANADPTINVLLSTAKTDPILNKYDMEGLLKLDIPSEIKTKSATELNTDFENKTDDKVKKEPLLQACSKIRCNPRPVKNRLTLRISKFITKQIMELKLNLKELFILDKNPMDELGDEDEPMQEIKSDSGHHSDRLVIVGRILPTTEPYCQCIFSIEITLPIEFPIAPPEVRFLTPIYHPNVHESGQFCYTILSKTGSWCPSISLADVVKILVHAIDHPSIEYAASPELGKQYLESREEFDKIALEYVEKYGLPRT
ncbi:hypothetical protein I4U23_012302 [Adineta vaga]|nr:hypothetical protein I4U23_012302 [Adineta vaga]